MSAEQYLAEGRLTDALSALQQQVRSDPANPAYRTFLFQLFAVTGQWERALKQLNVVAELDDATLAMARTYESALHCEVFRQDVFQGKRSPLLFGRPSQWMALLLQALKLAAEGDISRSQTCREQAFELAPASSGTIDGQQFSWLADADPRLGPVIEANINGSYYWVPVEHIRKLQIEPPSDLRDLVWLPAHFTWTNGGETVALLPSRYPGSESSDDPQIQLARRTEWADLGNDLYTGLGQKMLTCDSGDFPLMEVREICLNNLPDDETDDTVPPTTG